MTCQPTAAGKKRKLPFRLQSRRSSCRWRQLLGTLAPARRLQKRRFGEKPGRRRKQQDRKLPFFVVMEKWKIRKGTMKFKYLVCRVLYQSLAFPCGVWKKGKPFLEYKGRVLVDYSHSKHAKTRTDFVQRPAALIQSELFIMTGNSSGLDPTPKRNHRAEVGRGILADCHFLVDPTLKQIYSAEVRYSKRRHANCSPPTTTTTQTTTTTYTVLGPDGFAAGKKGFYWGLNEISLDCPLGVLSSFVN